MLLKVLNKSLSKLGFTLALISILTLGSFSSSWANEEHPALFFHKLKTDAIAIKAPQNDPNLTHINQNTKNYFKLLELMDRLKTFTGKFGLNIAAEIEESDGVLTGEHIYLIGKTLHSYHQLTMRMLEYSSIYNIKKLSHPQFFIDYQSKTRTLNNIFWLSNHMVMFNHYAQIYELFMTSGRVRRTMKNVLKAESLKNVRINELKEMMAHTIAKDNQKTLKKYLKNFHAHSEFFNFEETNEEDRLLKKIANKIEKYQAANLLLSRSNVYSFSSHGFIDGIINTLEKVTNIVSGFFGNTVGMVRWREGHLFNYKPTQEELEKRFKPMDILLEKTRFALTDTFIPGNFGHAALWLGTEKQLKELGLWDSPTIKPYQEKIRQGYQIVEALRPGVRLATLEQFMQIDEIAVLRNNDITKDLIEMEKTYKITFDQLGKDYDFNFDVGTIDTIVCSELIFMAMGKVKWPTKFIMGRATISPDNLAELVFFEGSPIKLLYYVEAKERHVPITLEKSDLAERIGYAYNKETSTEQKPIFDKKYLSCKNVYNRRIRVGSHRHRHLKKRVCLTKLKHQIYKAPREHDNKIAN